MNRKCCAWVQQSLYLSCSVGSSPFRATHRSLKLTTWIHLIHMRWQAYMQPPLYITKGRTVNMSPGHACCYWWRILPLWWKPFELGVITNLTVVGIHPQAGCMMLWLPVSTSRPNNTGGLKIYVLSSTANALVWGQLTLQFLLDQLSTCSLVTSSCN